MSNEFDVAIHNYIRNFRDSNTNSKVTVRPSWIDKSFLGLFAHQDIAENELICNYFGEIYRTPEAMKLTDKSYLMRLGEQCYVDSKHSHFCEARFINDCRNQAGYNVRFSKKPEQYKAEVIAIRPINKNEELFVDYGRWYWLGHKVKPHRLTFSDLIRLKNSTCESYY